VIGVICALFDVPEKLQKLLYIICAILVIALVFALFGVGFSGLALRIGR
jgi:hypothetical protein